jgi:hypothetical protein
MRELQLSRASRIDSASKRAFAELSARSSAWRAIASTLSRNGSACKILVPSSASPRLSQRRGPKIGLVNQMDRRQRDGRSSSERCGHCSPNTTYHQAVVFRFSADVCTLGLRAVRPGGAADGAGYRLAGPRQRQTTAKLENSVWALIKDQQLIGPARSRWLTVNNQ